MLRHCCIHISCLKSYELNIDDKAIWHREYSMILLSHGWTNTVLSQLRGHSKSSFIRRHTTLSLRKAGTLFETDGSFIIYLLSFLGLSGNSGQRFFYCATIISLWIMTSVVTMATEVARQAFQKSRRQPIWNNIFVVLATCVVIIYEGIKHVGWPWSDSRLFDWDASSRFGDKSAIYWIGLFRNASPERQ